METTPTAPVTKLISDLLPALPTQVQTYYYSWLSIQKQMLEDITAAPDVTASAGTGGLSVTSTRPTSATTSTSSSTGASAAAPTAGAVGRGGEGMFLYATFAAFVGVGIGAVLL